MSEQLSNQEQPQQNDSAADKGRPGLFSGVRGKLSGWYSRLYDDLVQDVSEPDSNGRKTFLSTPEYLFWVAGQDKEIPRDKLISSLREQGADEEQIQKIVADIDARQNKPQ
jgi:hypothetical protein